MSVASVLNNKNFVGLLLANTLLAAAFPIQLVLGGLSGLMLAPNEVLATLPSSIQTLAGLLTASPFSLLMGRLGRKVGFTLGSALTAIGAFAAVMALFQGSFVLLCVGHFLMGAGWASFQFFRFAAGEIVDKSWRPVSISLMLTSGLVAAIIGPQVFISAKDALAPIPFAGAYLAIVAICALGLLPLVLVRIPRPNSARPRARPGRFSRFAALRNPRVRQAVATASASQGIMVFMMVPTPIAMIACGFTDTTASDVVRWHIVAMFAPSFFTGFFIKRFGAPKIAMIGLVVLALASAIAAVGISAWHFYSSLIILGLGWNFGFIGATSMLADAVAEDEAPYIQGANDTIIALVSTICAFSTGTILAGFGWTVLAIIAATIALVALLTLAFQSRIAGVEYGR